MEPNRLNELLKQKALLEQHLAWLESEIIAEQCGELPLESSSPSIPTHRLAGFEDPPPLALKAPKKRSSGEEQEDPDPKTLITDVYDRLGPDTKGSAQDARKGCLILFAAAFAILGLVTTWVFIKY